MWGKVLQEHRICQSPVKSQQHYSPFHLLSWAPGFRYSVAHPFSITWVSYIDTSAVAADVKLYPLTLKIDDKMAVATGHEGRETYLTGGV